MHSYCIRWESCWWGREPKPETPSPAGSHRDSPSISQSPTPPSSLSSPSSPSVWNTRIHLTYLAFSVMLHASQFSFIFFSSTFPSSSPPSSTSLASFSIFHPGLMAFLALTLPSYPPHWSCWLWWFTFFPFPWAYPFPLKVVFIFIFPVPCLFIFAFRGIHATFRWVFPLFFVSPLTNPLFFPSSFRSSCFWRCSFPPRSSTLPILFSSPPNHLLPSLFADCCPIFQLPRALFKFIFFQLPFTMTRFDWQPPPLLPIPSL